MNKLTQLLLLSLLTISGNLFGAEIYVSPNGRNKSDGSKESPMQTIAMAVKRLKPGDVCYVRGGRYHEQVDLSGIEGTADAPIRIEAYDGEEVTLSGAKELNNLKWERYKGDIYVADLGTPISQLFVDGVSMSSARWPNANWIDGSLWGDKMETMVWPEGGTFGKYQNERLRELDFSMEGGIILVNSGSYITYPAFITKHEPSSNSFEYDTTNVKDQFKSTGKVKQHGYYFEGKKELIDVETEWFYDTKERRLYLYAPEGQDPSKLNVEGKTSTYFFNGAAPKNLTIKGFNFFGTTFRLNNGYNVRVEDCTLLYPSYSKRMLGKLNYVEGTMIFAKDRTTPTNCSIINCHFSYGDGSALNLKGKGIRVENCTFHDFDYSCINGQDAMVCCMRTEELLFRRNRAWNTGNSALFQMGANSIAELNEFMYCGYLQNDGSLMQVTHNCIEGTIIRNNWCHDAVKMGIRFDNANEPGSPWGEDGTANHNVTWRVGRTFFKGDNHFVFNNLCFDSTQNDLIVSANVAINGRNFGTITRNNLANKLSGDIDKSATEVPLPGHHSNNWTGDSKGQDIRSQLRDPDNLDFRPRKGSEVIDGGVVVERYSDLSYVGKSPDIGAYEYNDTNYWIPGPKLSKASVAIPVDGTTTAKADADLMWLGAYKSNKFVVYFGESKDKLRKISTQSNNICTPKQPLAKGKSYYWRVDSVVGGEIREGDVWSFSVEK